MSLDDSKYSKPVYKCSRGKWKELGIDNDDLPRIKDTEHTKDLEKKSILELEEMILRQEKILNNKAFITNLKDKGSKLRKKYEDLLKALKFVKKNTEEVQKTKEKYELPEDINFIEWQGKVKENFTGHNNVRNKENEEEDEEESNPLQLLARHSVEYPQKNDAQKFNDEESSCELIAKELEKLNIEDAKAGISSTSNEVSNENCSSNYFGNKILDFQNVERKRKKEPFRPYRSLNVNKNSTVTSVKAIPIAESLKLMAEAHHKNKEKYYTEATGALKESNLMGMSLPTSNNLHYRDANTSQHILEEYDDEINDYLYSGLTITEDEDDANEY